MEYGGPNGGHGARAAISSSRRWPAQYVDRLSLHPEFRAPAARARGLQYDRAWRQRSGHQVPIGTQILAMMRTHLLADSRMKVSAFTSSRAAMVVGQASYKTSTTARHASTARWPRRPLCCAAEIDGRLRAGWASQCRQVDFLNRTPCRRQSRRRSFTTLRRNLASFSTNSANSSSRPPG